MSDTQEGSPLMESHDKQLKINARHELACQYHLTMNFNRIRAMLRHI